MLKKKQLSVNHDVADVQKPADGSNLGGMLNVAKPTAMTWPEETIGFLQVVPIATPTECLPENHDHA